MSSTPPNFDSLRKSFIPPSNEEKTKKKTIKIQNEKEPNIMEQMVSYNQEVTNTLITQLNEELDEQKQINTILKEKNYDENKIEIEEFVNDHKEIISNQLNTLDTLFKELKQICIENKELHDEQSEYNEVLSNTDVIKISNDMIKLKSLKNNILLFLQQNGIHVTN